MHKNLTITNRVKYFSRVMFDPKLDPTLEQTRYKYYDSKLPSHVKEFKV